MKVYVFVVKLLKLIAVVLILASHIKEHLKEIMGMDDEAVEKYMNVRQTYR